MDILWILITFIWLETCMKRVYMILTSQGLTACSWGTLVKISYVFHSKSVLFMNILEKVGTEKIGSETKTCFNQTRTIDTMLI